MIPLVFCFYHLIILIKHGQIVSLILSINKILRASASSRDGESSQENVALNNENKLDILQKSQICF
jgi:hypothetical protein